MHFTRTDTTHFFWDGEILRDDAGWVYFYKNGEIIKRTPDHLETYTDLSGKRLSGHDLAVELERHGVRFANPSDLADSISDVDLIVMRIDQLGDHVIEKMQELVSSARFHSTEGSKEHQQPQSPMAPDAPSASIPRNVAPRNFQELCARANVLDDRGWYTVKEVARLLIEANPEETDFEKIRKRLRNKYCALGRVKCERHGTHYLIARESVLELLDGIIHRVGTFQSKKKPDPRKGANLKRLNRKRGY